MSAAPAPFELELELRLVRAAAFPLDRDPVVCPRERDDAVGLVRVAAFARGRDVLVFRARDVLVFRALDVLGFRALLALFALAALLALLPELGRDFALVLRVPPDDLVVAIRAPLAPVYVPVRTRLPKRSTR